MTVSNAMVVRCDGCGQMASSEHIARRLRRLEWATRYRPVHIQTLLLGAASPLEDADFLYSPNAEFRGEAAQLLRAIGISFAGRPAEEVHAEVQGKGLFVAHLLECPLENDGGSTANLTSLLREHLPLGAARIRRSLKPRRVILVTEVPEQVMQDILSMDLGCPVVLDDGKPFQFSSSANGASFSRFRESLGAVKGN
jgi:hypothetical protein